MAARLHPPSSAACLSTSTWTSQLDTLPLAFCFCRGARPQCPWWITMACPMASYSQRHLKTAWQHSWPGLVRMGYGNPRTEEEGYPPGCLKKKMLCIPSSALLPQIAILPHTLHEDYMTLIDGSFSSGLSCGAGHETSNAVLPPYRSTV